VNESLDLTPAIERPHRPVWRQLLKTTEGYILLLGIAIALAGLSVMAMVTFWSPQLSEIISAMIIANLTFGSVVSMSIGYVAGYSYDLPISVNMWIETVVVLLFYPVFVLSMRKLVIFPRLKRVLDRTQKVAESHHGRVRRYGIIGLFMFVWIPFWMTGPVVGSAIGYLLGFPAWITLTVVILGDFMTMLTWSYFLLGMYTRAAALGPWASVIIIAIIMLFVLAAYLLERRDRNRKPKEPSQSGIDQ